MADAHQHVGNGTSPSEHERRKKEKVTATAGCPPRFKRTETEDKQDKRGKSNTDVLKDGHPGATAADGLEGLA